MAERYSFVATEETIAKVNELAEASGLNKKEWFEKAVAIFESQMIKHEAPEYTKELSQVEYHTTRIYEMVNELVKSSVTFKKAAVDEVQVKLEQREALIASYEEKAKTAQEDAAAANELLEEAGEEKINLLKQINELNTINENNLLLINELKMNADEVREFIQERNIFIDEIKELNATMDERTNKAQSVIDEYKNDNLELIAKVKELELELERVNERKEYELQKALLELEREYIENQRPVRVASKARIGVGKRHDRNTATRVVRRSGDNG